MKNIGRIQKQLISDDMQQMLEDGEIDMVTSARKTLDREEKFDFSRPIGTNHGMLTVRSDNSTIVDGNYSTYNGMRVALLNGNTRNEEFADFADNKGFTYVPSYFDTTAEMDEALQSGNVDAIVTSSLRKINNERIVDKFGSSDFYVIVKKGNTELLDEVNYAIDQMNAVEGDWKTTLYNKNYGSTETKNLKYTEKEKSIIAQYSKDNPLHVLCDPTRYPYSYNENGEMKGIIPDYFREIADYAGISYEFLTPVTRDEYIAYQGNKEATDISIDARLETDNYAETKEWALTAPYITMQLAKVTRRDFDGKINVVATVDQTASNSIADAMAPGAEKLMCSTRQEMMEAVRKGKADAAFVYYYMAQSFVNSDTTGTMTYTLLEQPTFTYRMVVSSTENHVLAGILTKAMYAMPQNLVEDLAAQYTTYKATELVQALKEAVNLPIQLHTHYTSGEASMTYLKAVEAGVDVIDTAMSPFALGTSQPATEVMVETFKGTPYDSGLDQNLLAEIADYFRPIRDEALESGLLNPKNLGVNIKTLLYQVPGGMLSNLTSQLKEQGAEDRFYDVLEEVPRVRKDLGEPPLVTPSSQIVGTQAVFNVLMGERYKVATQETKDILSGKYGKTAKPFNPDVVKKVLGDNPEVITCRPADLIPDELDTLRKECAQWIQQDEDVLSYALFPQVATEFFKYRQAQQTKVDQTIADTENGSYPV